MAGIFQNLRLVSERSTQDDVGSAYATVSPTPATVNITSTVTTTTINIQPSVQGFGGYLDGILPPDIATALAEYVQYAAIQSYYILESHLASSPATSISISSINGTAGQLTVAAGTYIKGQSLKVVGASGGTGTGLTAGVTYYVLNDASGTSIQITDSYQNALAGIAGLTTGAGTVTVSVFETKTGAPVPVPAFPWHTQRQLARGALPPASWQSAWQCAFAPHH